MLRRTPIFEGSVASRSLCDLAVDGNPDQEFAFGHADLFRPEDRRRSAAPCSFTYVTCGP